MVSPSMLLLPPMHLLKETLYCIQVWITISNHLTHTMSDRIPLMRLLPSTGSFSDPPSKNNYPMGPMAMPPPQPGPPFIPPHGYHPNGSVNGSVHGNNQMLEYLENQVRGMDMASPMLQPQHHTAVPLQNHQPQYMPQPVSFPARPPSMLSALDGIGVQGVERRVIQLPPIVGRAKQSSRRANDGARGKPRQSSQSSGSSNRNGYPRDDSCRGPASSRREIPRSYSDESDWGERRGGRGSSGRRRGSGPQVRSKGELLEELERSNWRDRSYSPAPRRNSWSSDEDNYRKGTRSREKPPDYSTIDILPGHSRRNDQVSVRI